MKNHTYSPGWIAVVAIGVGAISGCEREVPVVEPAVVPEPSWEEFTDDFFGRHFAATPTAAVWAGLHEYDGQLQEVTDEAIRRRADMLREYAQRAEDEFSAGTLTAVEEIERQQLVSAIEGMLFDVEVAEYHLSNPAWYAGPLSPSVYVSREYAPKAERLAALTAHLQNFPRYIEQMRGTLQPPFPRPFVRTSLVQFGGLASHLQDDAPGLFADVEDPDLQAAFAEAVGPAVMALRDTESWLELELENATEEFALGEERYRELLWRAYRIDLNWQTLKEVAETDLARNLELLRATCALVDPEITVADCAARVRVGQILDALMRDVRYLSSIGLHIEGMSVETSQRMFAELAYLDPGNAEQQALRGTYGPNYFIYTLGKLIIMKMREDWTAQRGGRAAWKEFHEEFLSLGSAPLPVLREAMMGPEDPGPLL